MSANGSGIALNQERALNLFTTLAAQGYAVSIKHIRRNYYVEIPVRLRGDKAYGKEAEIIALCARAGFQVIQAGQMLRVA